MLAVSSSEDPPVNCSDVTSGGAGSWRWAELVELWLDKAVKKRSSKEKQMSCLKTFSPFLPDSDVFKVPLIFLLHKPKNFSFLKIIEAILVHILVMDIKIQAGCMTWLQSDWILVTALWLVTKSDSYPTPCTWPYRLPILVHSI